MWLCCTFHNSCQHWGCNLWQEVIISFMGSQVKNTVNDCYEEQSSGSLVVYQVGNSCNKTITRHLLLFSISKYLLSDDKGRGDNWVFSPPTTGCQAPITALGSQHVSEVYNVSESTFRQTGTSQYSNNRCKQIFKMAERVSNSPWAFAHWRLWAWARSALSPGRIGSVRALLSDRLLRISRACFPFVASNWPMSAHKKLWITHQQQPVLAVTPHLKWSKTPSHELPRPIAFVKLWGAINFKFDWFTHPELMLKTYLVKILNIV